jgi:hypothetical protein
MITRTRLAGAWTRATPEGSPLGRLHAVRRVNGALESNAMCGLRLPEHTLTARPFIMFEPDHAKACEICIVEAEEEP